MKPIRLALVGFGRWGRNYVSAARESGEAEVAVVVTSPESVLTGDPALGGAHCVEHLGHALSPDVDAVVFSGNPAHAPIVSESVLCHGLPLLVEKPAGLSVADAELIAAAEESNRQLVLVGHQHLFSEGYEALRDAFFGCFAMVTSEGPVQRETVSPLWDYGPHAVAMALGMIGHAKVGRVGERAARGSSFDLLGQRIPGGYRSAQVNAGLADERRVSIEVWPNGPDEGSVRYDAYASQAEPPLTRQIRAFARAIRSGGTNDYRFGAHWAVDVAKVLEQAGPMVSTA